MAVDGDIEKILDLIKQAGRPPYREQSLAEARAGYQVMVNLMDPDEEPIHRTQERGIPGPAGEISVRLYWPREAEAGEALGVFIYLHGGGFVIGDLDTTIHCAGAYPTGVIALLFRSNTVWHPSIPFRPAARTVSRP